MLPRAGSRQFLHRSDVVGGDEAGTGEDRETATEGVGVGHLEVQQDDRDVTLQVLLLIHGEDDVAGLNGVQQFGREVEAADGQVAAKGVSGPQTGYLSQLRVDPTGFDLTTSYGYDAAGNLIAETDARGNTTQYVVNELNRAHVYFSSLAGEEADDEIIDALASHRARLQSSIARQIRTKKTPILDFQPDVALRSAERIDDILREDRHRRGEA